MTPTVGTHAARRSRGEPTSPTSAHLHSHAFLAGKTVPARVAPEAPSERRRGWAGLYRREPTTIIALTRRFAWSG